MFSQASVILFTGGWQTPPGRHTPPGQTPLADTPWADTPWAEAPRADTPPGRHPPGKHLPSRHPPPRDGYCSGRYAFYWNAFLVHHVTILALFLFL